MVYLGVDAAWGKINETGVLALDPSGRVLDAGWTVGLEQTVAWICDNADDDCLVFVDAPLIVTNEDKQRLCEKHVGQRYWKAKVSANSTNINSRHLGGVALRKALQQAGFVYDDGLDGPPPSLRPTDCRTVGSGDSVAPRFSLCYTGFGYLSAPVRT